MTSKTKNKILTSAIFALLAFSSTLVWASSSSPSIPSNGLITYPAYSSLRVDGKRIVDALDNNVLLRGFDLWEPHVFQPEAHPLLSLERFEEIKAWGFNTINIRASWARIERDFNQIGVYSEQHLQYIERVVDWCTQAGLYVIVSLDMDRNWWGYDPTSQSVAYALSTEGQDRYRNFMAMIVQRFNSYDSVIGFCGWFFPFHGYGSTWYNSDWEDCYNNVYTPMIVNTIRTHSNKIIFYAPCYQGGTPDEIDTGQFNLITPLNDDNVVYGHRLHRGRGVGGNSRGVESGDDWDWDYAYVESQIQPAIDFMNTYNVPVCAIEFGLFTRGLFPIKQSRLDCQDYKFQLMNDTGSYHWTYWLYGDDKTASEGILNADLTLNAVGEQVVRWAST